MSRAGEPPRGQQLFRLVSVGIFAWLMAALGWVLWQCVVESDSYAALIGLIAAPWYVGQVPGGIMMLLYGAVRVAQRRLGITVVVWAAASYFLPWVLARLSWLPWNALPPEIRENAELDGASFVGMLTFGLLLSLFYLAGLGVGFLRRRQSLKRVASGLLAPPLVAVMGLHGALWLGVAASPHWRSRDFFALSTPRIDRQQGLAVMEAALEVKRGGPYHFQASYNTRFAPGEIVSESGWGVPIQWVGAGAEGPQEAGTYRMRLEWHRADDLSFGLPRPSSPSAHQEFVLRISEASGSARRLLREFRVPVSMPSSP